MKINDMSHSQVKKLIRNIKRRKSITFLDIYSSNEGWVFYYLISGFLKDSYFDICIRKHHYSGFEIEIAHTTENKQELKKALKL